MVIQIAAIWLVVCVILVVAFRLYPRRIETDHKALAKETIANELPEFKVKHLFLREAFKKEDKHKIHGIAIDADAKRFCLITDGIPQPFDYGGLIEAEIVVEGTATDKHSRLVKFIGTSVGDVIIEAYERFGDPKDQPFKLFGIPIKIKFNLYPRAKSDDKPQNVDLRLIVQDEENPFRSFSLLESDTPKPDALFAAKKEASIWFELLKKIMVAADEAKKEPDEKSLCVADEIAKLTSLKRDGILTEEEYIRVKNRLVGIQA